MARIENAPRRRQVYKNVHTPVGTLTLVATDEGLAAILWENDRPGRVPLSIGREESRHPVLLEAERQLQEYFAGQRKAFALKLDPSGTAFQRKVWNALLTIPFGETRSYAEIANQIGHPRAMRAVGAANGRNPLSIVTPCHRVIGSTGALTGFAGGLDVKARLLAFEAAGQPQSARSARITSTRAARAAGMNDATTAAAMRMTAAAAIGPAPGNRMP